MSITTSYKTEIVVPKPQLQAATGNIQGTPCIEIMGLAVQKIAQERGGRVTDEYQDCTGKKHRCIMGLSTPKLPNGVGVQVGRDGKVSFVYDQQGANRAEAQAICNDLARAYATIAVMRIHSRHGYQVRVESETRSGNGISVTTRAVSA